MDSRRASVLDNVDVLCMYVCCRNLVGSERDKETGNAGNLQLDTCYIHTGTRPFGFSVTHNWEGRWFPGIVVPATFCPPRPLSSLFCFPAFYYSWKTGIFSHFVDWVAESSTCC